MPPARILVVEDEKAEREALARVLRLEGFDVLAARNPTEALGTVDDTVDLVVSDMRMGAETGTDLLRAWRRRRPGTPFVMVTGFGTVDAAVEAMKLGAQDFLCKPVDPPKLLDLIRRLLGRGGAGDAAAPLARLNQLLGGRRVVGASPALAAVADQTLRAAAGTSTVLVLGESGTGKELIAEALHRCGPRRDAPFVVVNMAAIPEALAESDLFGHRRGAFTHAVADRVGRFQAADRGTLFVDEIGDFPLPVQAKLLRALEARTVCPVGDTREIPVDVRVVAATSRPLARMVRDGRFRDDLYFRLNVVTIEVPPLRDRPDDVALLVEHFLAELAAAGHRPCRAAPELLDHLRRLDWPGNVRQLRNCLERMTVLARGEVLGPADLPADLDAPGEGAAPVGRLEVLKRSAILAALDQADGNRTRAAAALGISVRTLQRKLRDWGMAGPPGG